MKLLKLLINVLLAAIAVALTFVVVFLLTPPWQKAAVEQVLARDTARKWQIGPVNIRPNRITLEEVFVLDGDVGARAGAIHVRGPFWKAPFNGVLEVDEGLLSGLEVDLAKVRVGDLTSEDYQAFLKRVPQDAAFWKERVGLILSRFAAAGLRVRLRDTSFEGKLLMPGGRTVPVGWQIVEADSAAPRTIRIEPLAGKHL